MANPFSNLSNAGLGLVILVIVLAVGAMIVQGFHDNVDASSQAANITSQGLTALSNFSTWFPTIVVVLVGATLLGLVLYYFAGRETAGI